MPSAMTRLYLRGLPEFVGVEQVSKHLAGYGKLVEVKIHQGYGFVQFENEKNAADVFEVLRRNPFMGTDITVEYARPPRKTRAEHGSAQIKPRYAVLVKNIPRGTCWQELKDFGRLAGGFVAFCNIDKSRRSGFIEYSSRYDAHKAVSDLNGQKLGDKVVTLSMLADNENIRPTRRRSRSPPRICIYDRYNTHPSPEALEFTHPYDNDSHCVRGRSAYTPRSYQSFDTSNTEPLLDHIDPYTNRYVTSHQTVAAGEISHAYDEFEFHLRDRDVYDSRPYDSRWAYT